MIPCSTCNGTGEVYEETQRGIPGSGGVYPCPDCDGVAWSTCPWCGARGPDFDETPQPTDYCDHS